MKLEAPQKLEQKAEDKIKILADKVANLMNNKGENFNTACNLVLNNRGKLSEKRKKEFKSQIASTLGKRGAQRKDTLKRRRVEPGSVFTPEERAKIHRGAELKKLQEERRAGQSEEESGFI